MRLLVERMQAYYDSQKQLLQQKKAGFQQKKRPAYAKL